MKQPNNYENTEAYTGDGQRLTAGGKICIVVNAYETKARSGMPMLAVEFDIAEGEEKEYYAKAQEQFGGDWRGVYRQGTEDKEGNCSPFFKGMISAIEESNDRYKFNFEERTLIGKRFGGVFGEEEYEAKDGTIKTSVKLLQIRSVDAIRKGNFKVPPKKTIAPKAQSDETYTSIDPASIPF